VFENIIEQGAVLQLQDDILSRRLAPSMLFFGPPETGKGSAALELARVLSCEGTSSWKCSCSACQRHRYLQHADLLMLGPRSFPAEISACRSVFLRNPSSQSAKILFIRSLRKLQIRFSAILMEDDPKLSKISPILQSLEEDLSEFWTTDAQASTQAALEKICGSLVKNALALVDEGLSAAVPIGHIRRAAYWCRLAPNGKRKTLVIENVENMREEARNSLLKLLEEPPDTVRIVLTSQRREAIMPTILSRLRPYRFLRRSAESEKEVIRRVFQDTVDESVDVKSVDEKSVRQGSGLVSAYLDSFLPAGTDKLYPLAAWFIVSLARIAASSVKKNSSTVPMMINLLEERYAQIADASATDALTAGAQGFERPARAAVIVKKLLAESGNFEDVSFSDFLEICLNLVCDAARGAKEPQFIAYNELFGKYITEADTAVSVLNINVTLALEELIFKLKTALIRGRYG
jgi:DNA polymerase-3 subunit gamma/tau